MKPLYNSWYTLSLLLLFFFPNPLYAQHDISNGWVVPANTPNSFYRAFVVFAEVKFYDEGGGQCPCADTDNPNGAIEPQIFKVWPVIGGVTQPPTYSENMFNHNMADFQSDPRKFTQFFYDASFGNFVLFGDYYDKVLSIPCSLLVSAGSAYLSLILDALNNEPDTDPVNSPGTLLSVNGILDIENSTGLALAGSRDYNLRL